MSGQGALSLLLSPSSWPTVLAKAAQEGLQDAAGGPEQLLRYLVFAALLHASGSIARLLAGAILGKSSEERQRKALPPVARLATLKCNGAQEDVDLIKVSHHNPQRQAVLATGQAVDHLGSVAAQHEPGFDIEKTIFKTLDSQVARAMIKAKTGNRMLWAESRVTEVQQLCESRRLAVPRAVGDTFDLKAILSFMESDCDFKMEHADGSFLDHLEFCRDFSALYMRQASPRILFLHSIMGVGTNIWPMAKGKIPVLQKLVTPEEFVHVQAFPTVLRLIKGTGFLQELFAMAQRGETKRRLHISRALDGAKISLSWDELWTHLNFHLIHGLDFLPAMGWSRNWNDPFMQEFCGIYILLKVAGKMECELVMPEQIRCDLEDAAKAKSIGDLFSLDRKKNAALGGEGDALQGLPGGCLPTLMRSLPAGILSKTSKKTIIKFSKVAGVSLEYSWE